MRVGLLFAGVVLALSSLVAGCTTVAEQRADVRDDSAQRVTVGTVQRQIRIGMPSSQVVEALGSPNLVTTDEQRREVWVYDKVATETAYTTSEGYLTIILAGVSGSSGVSSTNQRTLTIVIKYDAAQKVRDYSYHYTSF